MNRRRRQYNPSVWASVWWYLPSISLLNIHKLLCSHPYTQDVVCFSPFPDPPDLTHQFDVKAATSKMEVI